MKLRQASLSTLRPLTIQVPSSPVVAATEKPDLAPELKAVIKKALSLSFLIYQSLPYVEFELNKAGFNHIKPVSRWYTGTQAVCCVQEGHAYIVFRGSESLLDWVIDFAFIPFFWPLRHLGFGLAWRSVRKDIETWLVQIPKETRQIFICGHSLGGGIAHLAAFSLVKEYDIGNVVTFGAPKVSFLGTEKRYNATFAGADKKRTLKDVTYCVVNQRDVVASVPPALFGFRDVGQLIYIDQNNQVHSGDAAAVIQSRESMSDIDTLLEFFEDERQAALPQKPSRGWEMIYRYFQAGVRWLSKTLPMMKTALIPPVIYLLLSFYFMRSGLAHLTGKYIPVFFDGSQDTGFTVYTPSCFRLLTGTLLRLVAGTLLTGGFIWGLYRILTWSLGPLFQ